MYLFYFRMKKLLFMFLDILTIVIAHLVAPLEIT